MENLQREPIAPKYCWIANFFSFLFLLILKTQRGRERERERIDESGKFKGGR